MMNYVGSISIIDRGDAPAKAVIDKNARSLAQRVADDTKQELDKVMDRVEVIYDSYETSTQHMFDNPRDSPSVEYIEDIKELEEIIKDTVKKKKYQQQVTVFVVGFQEMCSQRLQLIQQVNQFFLENSKPDDEFEEEKLEVDLDEVANHVNESLNTAEELTKKLSELNQDMIEYLVNYANTKASNKGKKRLEKNLENARNDASTLSEKLLALQTDLEEKDEKLQQVVKQLELKTQESIRYKTAAEVAKKLEENKEQKLQQLKEEVDQKKMAVTDAEREMERLHRDQLANIEQTHNREIDDLRREHKEELRKLTGKSYGEVAEDTEAHPTSRQESRPSTKDTKSSRKSSSETKTKPPSKSPNRHGGKLEKTRVTPKEFAEASVQDEGGEHGNAQVERSNEPSRQPTRQAKALEPVNEVDGSELPNSFDLEDEESWASVPADKLPARFGQYRKISLLKIKEQDDQLNITLTKTHRKVNSLKAQFNEHKSKWENERKVLIEQVEQAHKLQTEAEKEADAAMTQLEEFINEQEKLEDEEENKRQEIVKSMSRPGTVQPGTPVITEPQVEEKEPEVVQATIEETEKKDEVVPQEKLQSEPSDHELKKLMRQTDDAKAQELNISRMSGAVSAPPAVEGQDGPATKGYIEVEPIIGKTEEEVRVSSAKSRASLRNQFKNRLEETRMSVEDRRAKSPAISIPSQKSLDDDQLVIEEDDDDDLPIPDEMKEEKAIFEEAEEERTEMGTSPPPELPRSAYHTSSHRTSVTSRHSIKLADHPVVHEYLRTYTGISNFKEAISRVLLDKDFMSASQVLTDLEMIQFDPAVKVAPQFENMTENVYLVLNEVSTVINSILYNDRGPVVSSLMMGMSRDPTQRSMVPDRFSDNGLPGTRTSQRSMSTKVASASTPDKAQYKELQQQYEKLQGQLSEGAKKYEEQLHHNTVVMMEMQDTINELQRELSALGKNQRRPASESMSTPGAGSQNTESAVMFTRLDSQRNAKIMKKAVLEQKLDPSSYKEVVVQMDEYVNLPAQRLAHLVRKYVHHCRMKEIEENVKKSNSLNENVFDILDKMEALQNQRAKRWADRMDEMGMERLRLANMLMETLDTIEQESGIFLIKPMYSYRGREPKERYQGKLSRPFRPQRTLSPLRDVQSAYAPAPTPASNMRTAIRQQDKSGQFSMPQDMVNRPEPVRSLDGENVVLMGASMSWTGTQQKSTWNMSSSQPRVDESLLTSSMNTPRILELDINRMMIGQNTISARVPTGLSDDRLVNASQNNLRSYMTVNRPAVSPGHGRTDRPRSYSGVRSSESPVPSGSPTLGLGSSSSKRVRLSETTDFPQTISGTPPLPPITKGRQTPQSGKGRKSPATMEPPSSPPGSSVRLTPSQIHDTEVISPVK